MDKGKSFVCGAAKIEAISKGDGATMISLDGKASNLACLCAATIRRIAVAMGKSRFEVLYRVLKFLQAEEITESAMTIGIDIQRIQDAMGGDRMRRELCAQCADLLRRGYDLTKVSGASTTRSPATSAGAGDSARPMRSRKRKGDTCDRRI